MGLNPRLDSALKTERSRLKVTTQRRSQRGYSRRW